MCELAKRKTQRIQLIMNRPKRKFANNKSGLNGACHHTGGSHLTFRQFVAAALFGEIMLKSGRFEQSNFESYQILRMNDAPAVEVHLVKSMAPPGGTRLKRRRSFPPSRLSCSRRQENDCERCRSTSTR